MLSRLLRRASVSTRNYKKKILIIAEMTIELPLQPPITIVGKKKNKVNSYQTSQSIIVIVYKIYTNNAKAFFIYTGQRGVTVA